MEVILAGADKEHFESAAADPRFAGGKEISFGTMLWEEPPKFPRDVPIYLYAVMRGTGDPEPFATWGGTFRRYLRMEQFPSRVALDATRPQNDAQPTGAPGRERA